MAYAPIWVPLAVAATSLGHQERVSQEQQRQQKRAAKSQRVQQDTALAQQQRTQQQAAAEQQRARSQAPDIAALLASAMAGGTPDTQLTGPSGVAPIGGRTTLG